MSTLTEGTRISDIIKRQLDELISRKLVTIVNGAGVLKKGTVLGTITASGKFTPYDPTSALGPQLTTAGLLAILGADVDASAADVPNTPVYWAGMVYSTAFLLWGAGVTTGAHKTAAYAGLALTLAVGATPA